MTKYMQHMHRKWYINYKSYIFWHNPPKIEVINSSLLMGKKQPNSSAGKPPDYGNYEFNDTHAWQVLVYYMGKTGTILTLKL